MNAASLAAPIRARGEVVAALSVVVRGSSQAAVRIATPGVRTAALGISRALDRSRR
jgi:DNA-binding IclR family transcriptional regulator